MLKQYAVEDLKAGMVVGHPIYSEDATVLIGEGTKLTNKLIFSLLERPIFSVYIGSMQNVVGYPNVVNS